jgi:hypothetical protein
MTKTRRWLPLLALLAAVSLYLVASACSSGDDKPASTTPAGTVTAATNTSPAGGAVSPTRTSALATTTAAGDRQVEILDSGFTALRGGLSGGFIAHNKDKTEAVAIAYNIPFSDSAGTPNSSAHGTLVLMPDETIGEAFEGSYAPEHEIASIDIQLNAAEAIWTAAPTKRLTTTITTTETQSVSGTVANPFSVATTGLWMHVITYNAAGKIIGGDTQGIDSVPANSSADFTAQVPFIGDDYANNARVEAYAEFRDQLPPGLAQ